MVFCLSTHQEALLRAKVESIKTHLINKEVGALDAIPIFLNGVEKLLFWNEGARRCHVFESTYEMNEQMEEEKIWSWHSTRRLTTMSFKYPQMVYNHYKFWHCVDGNNSKRHSPISLEITQTTKRSEYCVFTCLLAVNGVDCMIT